MAVRPRGPVAARRVSTRVRADVAQTHCHVRADAVFAASVGKRGRARTSGRTFSSKNVLYDIPGLSTLKAAARTNKHGFRFSAQFLFDISAVKNETQWILQHLYCSGLDKASNNACFICIRHIRLMAFERLNGKYHAGEIIFGLYHLLSWIKFLWTWHPFYQNFHYLTNHCHI
jgi:hypothetical protein